jgi:hypothetical protein
MARRSRRPRRTVVVPDIRTAKTQTKDYQYIGGIDSNTSNDDVSPDKWRYAVDVRQPQVGKWETRKGTDLFSVPIGEAVNVQETSTTGAANFSFNPTTWFAAKVTAGSTGRLSALEANIRNANSATGTVVLALYSDDSGSPGTELVRTTAAASSVSATYGYVKARTITCPDIVSGTAYWVIGYVQAGGSGSYEVSSTTNTTTGMTSTDSGQTFAAASKNFNVKLSTATNTPTLGTIRVRRPNGTKVTFMAHGTSVYTVDESTGVTTQIDSGLNGSSTYCRFAFVNDNLYYVTGLQKPRKYDFATATEVTGAPENASNIIVHKGIVFYQSATDPNKYFYTNFGNYDTFTSTDFNYADAPKTGDPTNAFAKISGNMYLMTRNNKFVLYGAENATFRLDNAIGQKGTFSQESVVYDESYIYLASDDGIYRFNGAEEVNITRDVLDWWIPLTSKNKTVLALHDNRLFVYYTPVGGSQNSACMVYHTLYGIWESQDTKMYVGAVHSRLDDDNYLLLGSNRIGMLMLSEADTNDYCNMGEQLGYELRTRYEHYEAPAQFKRAPIFRPHFDSQSGSYSVMVGYDLDYAESPNMFPLSLQSDGPRFDTGETFDSGVTFGGSAQVNPMDDGPTIPGEWRRLQIRYKHEAAREPVAFDGHVLAVETQRMI